MRTRILALAVTGLIAAGCGDGDSGKDATPRAVTADSFIDCFAKPGYVAERPAPREESVLAFQAKRDGYRVDPVNVTGRKKLVPAAFLVIFESPDKAAEAIEKLRATSYGSVPVVARGAAVIGYTDREERALVEPAINDCIE